MKLSGGFGEGVLAATTRCVGPRQYDYDDNDPYTTSRLRQYFGEATLRGLAGKRVVDFGCGYGADVVAVALEGAGAVVGVDVQEPRLEAARRCAKDHGVEERCRFVNATADKEGYAALGEFDAAISIDAFEHFADPAAVLAEMRRLLRPGGRVLISFGPPWKHPYGAHLDHFNRMPWIHFIFADATIMAVRQRYFDDGATRLEDVAGGLNRMTVARFEEIVERSGFRVVTLEPVPIRKLRPLARHRALREYVTSVVHAELEKC
jgi:ubiquinone/menaquinone biosynthesis C-methylase UbiE